MMPVRPSPTVRRRRLRYELRRLRDEHGLTIEQVQEASGGDIKAPSISRWENGERSVRPTDLRLLLDIYQVHGERREALLTLSRQSKERGWWQSYASAIPGWFQVYVGLEAEASTIRVYEAELVDGLLQTPDYYRAFLRAAPAAAADAEAERKIEVRLRCCRSPPGCTRQWTVRSGSWAFPSRVTPTWCTWRTRPVACTWKKQPRSTVTRGCSPT
jgi:transcriptional regulator with XRE-family HTH domain